MDCRTEGTEVRNPVVVMIFLAPPCDFGRDDLTRGFVTKAPDHLRIRSPGRGKTWTVPTPCLEPGKSVAMEGGL